MKTNIRHFIKFPKTYIFSKKVPKNLQKVPKNLHFFPKTPVFAGVFRRLKISKKYTKKCLAKREKNLNVNNSCFARRKAMKIRQMRQQKKSKKTEQQKKAKEKKQKKQQKISGSAARRTQMAGNQLYAICQPPFFPPLPAR